MAEPNPLLKGQGVSLGCGALILIALIVAFFSPRVDLAPVQSKLSEMDIRLQRLEEKLDQLSKKVNP
jgi:hypothetical protein